MKGIYRFYCNCGDDGDLESLFIADSEDVKKITGRTVHFGQIFGKNVDEVNVTIEKDDIQLLSESPIDIEVFERLNLTSVANHNPFNYIFFDN